MNINALCEKVYVYDLQAKAAVRPTPRDTPWPVLLLLGAFSVKHIFLRAKIPALQIYSVGLWNLHHTLRERLNHHKKFEKQWWYQKIKSKFPIKRKEDLAVGDAKADMVARNLHDQMWKHIKQYTSRMNNKFTKPFSNTILAFDWAKKWLQNGTWDAVQTDKDGGYCLVPKDVVAQMLLESLTDKYETTYVTDKKVIVSQIFNACKAVAEAYEDEQLLEWLSRKIHSSDPRRVVQMILFTIKTHKAAGKIKFRTIHSSVGHPATVPSLLIKKSFVNTW